YCFTFDVSRHKRDVHSFPTRRSSDLSERRKSGLDRRNSSGTTRLTPGRTAPGEDVESAAQGGEEACDGHAVVDRSHERACRLAPGPEPIAHRLGQVARDRSVRGEGEDAGPGAAEGEPGGAGASDGGPRFGVPGKERRSHGLCEPILQATTGES